MFARYKQKCSDNKQTKKNNSTNVKTGKKSMKTPIGESVKERKIHQKGS